MTIAIRAGVLLLALLGTARAEKPMDYLAEVQPVLASRCVVCHSCYNAPCQLKLGSWEGLDRGGSKQRVYLSSRLKAQDPTRLFFDASTTEQWRHKGFYSVIDSSVEPPLSDSIMLQLLAIKRQFPEVSGSYHAEADDLTCAASRDELDRFLARHSDYGMPFGFPALSEPEYTTLTTWLQQGAPGPTAEQRSALTTPGAAAAASVAKWEALLNRDDAKHAMTARYLYEHFFLAHLSFSDVDRDDFFQLVRSTTPPGQPIEVVASVRPYDPVPSGPVFYRFRKIHSTLVYKTHMVVELTDAALARIRELFLETPWLEEPHVVALDDKAGADPFLVYAQIPPRVRYQFLLDHAEYMIRTFIRGPVCKGQVALNVIHDHFWIFFLDPGADQIVARPQFLIDQAQNLRLPNEMGSGGIALKAFSDDYRERYAKFYRAKNALYESVAPDGFSLEAIWRGRVAGDAPALTVYRHFDSASVHKGVLGNLPRTLWVIDYAQFERIYYALVAGFDVFGSLTHQVNVRRYMDYLRIEGELNFLHFLPPKVRLPTLESWYIGVGAVDDANAEGVVSQKFGTKIRYRTDDPKRELVEMIIDGHLLDSTGIAFDRVNYFRAGSRPPPMPKSFETRDDVLDGFRALTAPGTAFIRYHNEFGVNVAYIRVRNYAGEDHFVSAVVNRWHDNVNSMFGEKKRLDPSKDRINFIPGSVGSYPNYFFDLDGQEIPDFFDLIANFDGSPKYVKKLRKYGVNRAAPDFWTTYDWFQGWLDAADPLRAGRYDLNRYFSDTPPPDG